MEELQKINIIYEDNHLLVVEKPINVPVCQDSSLDEDLLSMLKNYIKLKYNKPGNVYLGLIHRLDRPVGGVMVFAKTSKAASRLSDQVREHKLEKSYYAVLEGRISKDGELIDYLVKDNKKNISFVGNKNNGKLSKLEFRIIGYHDNVSSYVAFRSIKNGEAAQYKTEMNERYDLYLDKDIYMSFLMVVLIFYPLFDHTNILSLFYSKKQSTIDGKLQFVTRIMKHQSNK